MMRRAAICIATVLSTATAYAAAPATVGDMTQRHESNKWLRRVIVSTPSILPGMPPTSFAGDPQQAIENYDRVIELTDVPAARNEAMRRSAYLRIRAAEADPGPKAQEQLERAVALYRQLLVESPEDPANDRAYYQLARAQELLGATAEASRTLATLAKKYPASTLASDAHFRAAELLYLTKDYAAAEAEYRSVVDGAPAPYKQFAVYKYGWSLYHQGKYEEALPPFLSILDAELPANTDLAKDVTGVVSMAFASMGEGAIERYFARVGEPRYADMLYLAVGQLQEKLQRYSDAAGTYASFAMRRSADPAGAAQFQSRVIDAYAQGGFSDKVVEAKAEYVARYGLDAPVWKSAAPPAEISRALREHAAGLAQHYHSTGQAAKASEYYRRLLAWFPNDAGAADLSLLYADALHDAGQLGESAKQYLHAAYDTPRGAKSGEAALAAVQVYQELARAAKDAEHPAALRESIAASLKLAETFPQHPSWTTVVAQSAIDQVELAAWEDAIALAKRVLDSSKPIPAELRVRMLGVVADGEFAQGRFARAEAAYSAMGTLATERLAESIYRQAEAARAAGDLRLAAQTFQRVGRIAPGASIRATADYDAAAAWMGAQDWKAARTQLEEFRSRNPGHALIAQADCKLALAYQNDGLPAKAAEAYARVARRDSESTETRADAAYLAAQLYDESGATLQGSQAYEYYLASFAPVAERRIDVLQRLADIALHDRGDKAAYQRTLRDIVSADASAGSQRSAHTRSLAAHATLEIGRLQAQVARQVALRQPLAKSIAQRRTATESAIATLLSAADYHFADVTPAASYEIGRLYAEFADALVQSERPRTLQGLAREQYDVLLEEQSEPFEQKAILAHEANLERLRDNVWNPSIRASAGDLSALVPARYGKRESNEVSYDALR